MKAPRIWERMRPALSTVFASVRQDGVEALAPSAIVDVCLAAEAPAALLDGALRPALLEPLGRGLQPLARAAERVGGVVLVGNGRRYVDVPSPRELDRLRGELDGAPILPACDVAAAHLTDVMGFAPMALTLAAYHDAPLWYWG